MDAEAAYLKLPILLQNAVCSLHGWRIRRTRFGAGFVDALSQAEDRWQWNAQRMTEFRDKSIREFIRHAYETTRYHRRVFDEHGVSPDAIRGLDDLKRLPVLTKADVQAYGPDMVSDAVADDQQEHIHTSGTTGAGLKFSTTRTAVHWQWATWWRFWRLHGIRRDMWCGYFGGRSVVPLSQKKPPFWRINRPGRQIMFSAYHISPDTLPDYLNELTRRRPPWLHGYPSILAMIASHLTESGRRLGYTPSHISTGAENLLPQQSMLIERAFGVAPIQHYGMAEAVANVSMCSRRKMHVDEDFAGVEFVPTADGSSHRVIGTNFTNPATPLIRYDVGDVVDLGNDGCDCGLPGRIIRRVDGRQEDYVILKNGARLGRMDHIFKDMVAVREAQLYQNTPGVIIARIVRNDGYADADEKMLLTEFQKRVGDEADVHIEYVDEIRRSRTGKLRFVVSDIQNGRITDHATAER